MKTRNLSLRILLSMLAALALTACSKTVQWDEEVPLNTGETIWVKRSDFFKRSSEAGNPLKLSWQMEKRAYEFSWQGRKYSYETRTSSGGPILMHASVEEKTVSIIDSAWPVCPGYGEFRWLNGEWRLQQTVNPAVIGQPRNLMDYYSAEDGVFPSRVTQKFIQESRFDLPQRGSSASHLSASKIATNCVGKK